MNKPATMTAPQDNSHLRGDPEETVKSLTAISNDLIDAIAGVNKVMAQHAAKRAALNKELRGVHSKLVTLSAKAAREAKAQ